MRLPGSTTAPPSVGQDAELIWQLHERLARNPGELDAGLMLGSTLYAAGDIAGSAAVLRRLLEHHPDHTQALLLLARAEAHAGNSADALSILSRARHSNAHNPQVWQLSVALVTQLRNWAELRRIAGDWTRAQPNAVAAWRALSHGHFEDSQFDPAMAAFARVLSLEPGNLGHLVSAARVATAAGRHQVARHYLLEAEALAPESGEVLYALSRLHQASGELSLAGDYCQRAIVAQPGFAPAYTTLGLLREGRLSDTEIANVQRICATPAVHPEYRAMAGYTLGNALHQRGKYVAAFAAWEGANSINLQLSAAEGFSYSAASHEAELALIERIFAAPVVIDPGTGDEPDSSNGPQPIFVVGMPRSGTTLVESILAAHSTVHGGGELLALSAIHDALIKVAAEQGTDAARQALREQGPQWRAAYLAALPAADGARWVVDKLPMNFRSVGLIRTLFPMSPVICTQRDAMDVGLSIFRHNFAKNWPCASELRDIGHYIGFCQSLVALWQQRYPQALHVVAHAALVRDPDAEIRRLLVFAGLDEEAACFAPHTTRRAVATFSSVQVQRPVSASYGQQSAYYAQQLAPLREALLAAGVAI